MTSPLKQLLASAAGSAAPMAAYKALSLGLSEEWDLCDVIRKAADQDRERDETNDALFRQESRVTGS